MDKWLPTCKYLAWFEGKRDMDILHSVLGMVWEKSSKMSFELITLARLLAAMTNSVSICLEVS
jgi:hypothetical protein